MRLGAAEPPIGGTGAGWPGALGIIMDLALNFELLIALSDNPAPKLLFGCGLHPNPLASFLARKQKLYAGSLEAGPNRLQHVFSPKIF